ncbi:MAG: hypothetical protein ABSD89_04155 [Halobacteriota archaeon]
MVQLIPGLLYVIVLTAVFTVLLVSLTAALLLSQARAIVRQRYLGPVVSKRNVYKVAKLRPIRASATAILLQVKDIETNRLLTTFKRPAAMKLYEQCFYIKPYFTSGAYLIRVNDIANVSTTSNALVVTFAHEDRVIALQCRAPHISKWRDSLHLVISTHK